MALPISHSPNMHLLPEGFIDTVPTRDSFLDANSLEPYINKLQQLKKQYASDISIKIGIRSSILLKDMKKQLPDFQ